MERLLIVFISLISFQLGAQVLPQGTTAQEAEAAQKKLKESGLSQDEVIQSLEGQGIDINNIDPNDTQKLEELLEQAVQEKSQVDAVLEAKTEVIAKDAAEDIEKAVKEGASLEEAITEELTEEEDLLPPAVIWGQHIFRDKNLKLYRQSANIKPPNTYILGPGDEVSVSIWGASELSEKFTISEEGFIKPYRMGRIYLKGISLGKARNLIKSRYGKFNKFKDGEFEVALNFARTITVNMVGEVNKMGGFSIPATNTAFNALVAAGGPSDIGSVRNISIYRAGQGARSLDVYEYLNKPSIADDLFLQNNDVIHIPVADKLVRVVGAVKRPFVYELKKGEGLKELLKWAGGLKDNAYQSKIQVKRFENDKEVIEDVDFRALNNSGRNFNLRGGDIIKVLSIPKTFKNYVKIEGAVDLPGSFELEEGMKVSDLVKKGGLSDGALGNMAYIFRTKANQKIKMVKVDLRKSLESPNSAADIKLQAKDRLKVFSSSFFEDSADVSISGAVRNPGSFNYESSMRLSDVISLSGGVRDGATNFAYIYRKDPTSIRETEYIKIDLKEILDNVYSSSDPILEANDRIIVFYNKEFSDRSTVTVKGAVRKAIEIPYDVSLSLKDALILSGGLKREADNKNIQIFRVNIDDENQTKTVVANLEVDEELNVIGADKDFQLEPFDIVAVRTAREYELQRNIQIKGEVGRPGSYSLLGKNEKLLSLIDRSGGLTAEAFPEGIKLFRSKDNVGYIVIDLSEAIDNANSYNNVILQDGDAIEIPKKKDFVTITGAINIFDAVQSDIAGTGKINVPFIAGKNAKWYIDNYAAGINRDIGGRASLVQVEYPSGQVERVSNLGLFKSYPKVTKGALIKVNRKKERKKEDKEKKEIDWNEILTTTLTTVSAVLTLVVLSQQINN